MKINQEAFGSFEGSNVTLFTLSNGKGMQIKIMDFGATITSIQTPDKNGQVNEIVCGFDTFEGYFNEAYTNNAPYFGGTVGRYCSQIKDAKFSLNNEVYTLAANCGNNNLHGGTRGFDKTLWKATAIENKEEVSLIMKRKSPHLEEGFPGNVNLQVTFSLNSKNQLKITYLADTDSDTPLTLTNHTYFNLSGFQDSVLNCEIEIPTSEKLVWDESGAATGEVASVIGKADDLTSAVKIADAHNSMQDGFEHYYILKEDCTSLTRAASLVDPMSGRALVVETTEPGLLFYTGKYTSDELKRENGLQYGKHRGCCFETHRYPNGMNIANSPKSILRKDEKYESETIFNFSW